MEQPKKTRICKKCQRELPLTTEFFYCRRNHKNNKYYFEGTCRTCRSLKHKHNLLMSSYGISLEEYEQMRKNQNDKCLCCGRIPARGLVVDHCHTTNKVRGLLCNNCNCALGQVFDRTDWAMKLMKYLVKYGS